MLRVGVNGCSTGLFDYAPPPPFPRRSAHNDCGRVAAFEMKTADLKDRRNNARSSVAD
jgi:hypothetical protein